MRHLSPLIQNQKMKKEEYPLWNTTKLILSNREAGAPFTVFKSILSGLIAFENETPGL